MLPALALKCLDERADRAVAATRDREQLTVKVDLSVDADLTSGEEIFALNREQLKRAT